MSFHIIHAGLAIVTHNIAISSVINNIIMVKYQQWQHQPLTDIQRKNWTNNSSSVKGAVSVYGCVRD